MNKANTNNNTDNTRNINSTGTFTLYPLYPTETFSFINKGLEPDKIIYNGRVTIVKWNDGTQSRSTCSENEIFDEEIGFAVCLMKKMFGKKVYGKRLYERMISNAQKYKNNFKEKELPF